MALGAHFLLDLKVSAYTESDSSLSSGFDEHLQGHCVLMVDRGLNGRPAILPPSAAGRRAALARTSQKQLGVDGVGNPGTR